MARQPRRFARLGASPDLATQALFDSYIGPYGEITAHPGGLRFHDGFTPGGVPVDGSPPMTQARLDYVSPNQVRLVPAGGSYLWINGRNVALPPAINLSNAGLSELTQYYLSAYVSGSTVVLEASTTGFATAASGIRVKNGDPTRTHVGMLYTDTGGIFSNASNRRLVRSQYNRPKQTLHGSYASGSTSSTSAVEINPAHRVMFLAYSDDMIDYSFTGHAQVTTGAASNTFLGLDGANYGSLQFLSGSTGNNPVGPRATALVGDGVHTLSLRGSINGSGTGTWTGQILGSIS